MEQLSLQSQEFLCVQTVTLFDDAEGDAGALEEMGGGGRWTIPEGRAFRRD